MSVGQDCLRVFSIHKFLEAMDGLDIQTSLGSNKLQYSLNHDYNVFLII